MEGKSTFKNFGEAIKNNTVEMVSKTNSGTSSLLKYSLVAIGAAVIIGGGYFGYKALSSKSNVSSVPSEFKGALTISEYGALDKTGSQTVKLFGKISSLSSGDSYFMLESEGSSMYVYYDNMTGSDGNKLSSVSMEGFANDDYVIITGQASKEGYSFFLNKIEKTTEADINNYINSKKPSLATTILDYPRNVKHGCSTITMSVKLRNDGIVPVEYSKMYAKNIQPQYMIYYSVAGKDWYSFNFAGETNVQGYLGFKDFGTINPGEEKIVSFGGGGNVIQALDRAMSEAEGKPHSVSTAGNENMLISYEQGSATAGAKTVYFKFAVAKSGYMGVAYDPSFRSESNKITINLENPECDLTDILETKYIGEE